MKRGWSPSRIVAALFAGLSFFSQGAPEVAARHNEPIKIAPLVDVKIRARTMTPPHETFTKDREHPSECKSKCKNSDKCVAYSFYSNRHFPWNCLLFDGDALLEQWRNPFVGDKPRWTSGVVGTIEGARFGPLVEEKACAGPQANLCHCKMADKGVTAVECARPASPLTGISGNPIKRATGYSILAPKHCGPASCVPSQTCEETAAGYHVCETQEDTDLEECSEIDEPPSDECPDDEGEPLPECDKVDDLPVRDDL
jgi:hypothetical protein